MEGKVKIFEEVVDTFWLWSGWTLSFAVQTWSLKPNQITEFKIGPPVFHKTEMSIIIGIMIYEVIIIMIMKWWLISMMSITLTPAECQKMLVLDGDQG